MQESPQTQATSLPKRTSSLKIKEKIERQLEEAFEEYKQNIPIDERNHEIFWYKVEVFDNIIRAVYYKDQEDNYEEYDNTDDDYYMDGDDDYYMDGDDDYYMDDDDDYYMDGDDDYYMDGALKNNKFNYYQEEKPEDKDFEPDGYHEEYYSINPD